MAFDLATAKPVAQSGGFDLSTAKPVRIDLRGMAEPEPTFLQSVGQNIGNVGAGLIRGAGSIGATIMAPKDMISDALDGKGLSLESNRQRRSAMDAALGSMGAETDSYGYAGGKLGGEILGTAGAGGALANVVGKVAPTLVANSPRVAQLIEALKTGGFSLGSPAATTVAGKAADLGIRAAGGAISGGAQAAMINPEDAGMGAAIGGVLPVGVQAVGKVAGAIGDGVRYINKPAETRLANKLAASLGMTPQELASAINQPGPNRIPGYSMTVPQILQNPVSSQLQRTLKTAGQDALGNAERVQQQAYRGALERIAPIDISVQDAANRAGSAIQSYAIPARAEATKNVRQAFDAVDPFNKTALHLPIDEMKAAKAKFLGDGTFGTGGKASDAIATAEVISKAAPFQTVQNLRSSLGEAAKQAELKGANKESAALKQMISEIDSRVNRAAGGSAGADEFFPKDIADQYRKALQLHAEKMQKFETGPQVGMFRMGADGQPAIQGAEIPGKFYSGRRSQVEDIGAFNRLIDNNPTLSNELKRYAITEGANTGNTVTGDLTSKFSKWLYSRSGANRALFSPQENDILREVGTAVERGINAENLGRVSGSDTAQKLEALKNLGLLDSKLVDFLGTKIPGLNSVSKPVLSALRETAGRTRDNALAKMLANPDDLAKALKPGTPQSNALLEWMNKSGAVGSKAILPALADQ